MSKAFHALDLDVPSGEMLDVLEGTGVLTEGRTSTIYQPDWDDIWRSWGSGERAWYKGRKVRNRLLQSKNLSISWTNNQSDDEQNVGIAFDGTNTLNRIKDDSLGGTGQCSVAQNITVVADADYTLSAEFKADQLDWGFLRITGMAAQDIWVYVDLINGVLGADLGANNTGQWIVPKGNGRYVVGVGFTQQSNQRRPCYCHAPTQPAPLRYAI